MFSDSQAQHAQHAAGQAFNVYQPAPPHLAGAPYPYSHNAPPAGQVLVAQYAYVQVIFPATRTLTFVFNTCGFSFHCCGHEALLLCHHGQSDAAHMWCNNPLGT